MFFSGALNWRNPTLMACLAGAGLVILSYPDVVFRGASFSMMDQTNLDGRDKPRRELFATGELQSLYPERRQREPWHGYSDTGGAAWQSEPGQLFMRHVLYHLESPFWNPYSGAGALGPEVLADVKFSPFALLVALCGGSSLAFHVVALVLFAVSLAFLFRVVTDFFGLSQGSAAAAGIVYLLNGYVVANLNSNVSQAYVYFPICLYALFRFTAQPSYGRYLGVIGANLLMLMTTFMPTMSLLVMCIYLVGAVHAVQVHKTFKARCALLLGQWVSVVLATLLLAFLYLSILDSFSFLGTLEMYGARPFYPASLSGFLSFFTPKHYWESYNAINPLLHEYTQNVVFHMGIIPSLLLAQALVERQFLRTPLVLALAAILGVALARIFDVPGLTHVIGVLPYFRNIGAQYWWIAVAFAFPLLFAHGCEAMLSDRIRLVPTLVVDVVIAASLVVPAFAWLNGTPGFPDRAEGSYLRPGMAWTYLAVTVLFAGAATVLLWRLQSRPGWKLKVLILALMFAELVFYTNNLRWTRKDRIAEPPDHIAFLKRDIGHDRVMEYGLDGIFPELGSAYQVQQLGSMNMNIIPAYHRFYERNFLPAEHRWGLFCAQKTPELEPRVNKAMLDMMAVKYIVVSSYMKPALRYYDESHYPRVFEGELAVVYENPTRYPRAFAVRSLIRSDLTPDTQNLSPREVAFTLDDQLLESARRLGIPASKEAVPATAPGVVEVLAYHHAQVQLRAKLSSPAVVVLPDCWHPGWNAHVNGQVVYVGKVNEAFRGVALPAGEHVIEFRYQPRALRIGLILSGITALLLVMGAVLRRALQALLGRFLSDSDVPHRIPGSASELREAPFVDSPQDNVEQPMLTHSDAVAK